MTKQIFLNEKEMWQMNENKWFRKPWLYVLMIILILTIVGVPIVINEMYKYGATLSKPYITMWGADEVLSYYGTVLSFLGTFILGVVAYKQNERANKTNNELAKLTKQANELTKQANTVADFMSCHQTALMNCL